MDQAHQLLFSSRAKRSFEFEGCEYTYETLRELDFIKILYNGNRSKEAIVRNKNSGHLFYYYYNNSYGNRVDETFMLVGDDIDLDNIRSRMTYKEPTILVTEGLIIKIRKDNKEKLVK